MLRFLHFHVSIKFAVQENALDGQVPLAVLPEAPLQHQLAKSGITRSSSDESDMSLPTQWMSSEFGGVSAPSCPGWPDGLRGCAAQPLTVLGMLPSRCRLRKTTLSSEVADQQGRKALPWTSLSHWLEMLRAHATVVAQRPGKT